MSVFRRVTKKLLCPQCGDVLADADYRPVAGSLALCGPERYQLTPQMGAVHLRRAEQELATAPQITRALRRAKGGWVSLSEQ